MRNRARLFAIGGLAVVLLGAVADANVRVPSDAGPFYARVERNSSGDPLVVNDGEWAVVPFYRWTGCVPPDFNLLQLFDVPRVFGCEARVVGFEVWRELPPPPGTGPIQVISFALDGMEVWLVRWEELEAAMADDELTITELAGLPSLARGTAALFKETLHPIGAARRTKLQMVGWGSLEDGRSFAFASEANGEHITQAHIRVE